MKRRFYRLYDLFAARYPIGLNRRAQPSPESTPFLVWGTNKFAETFSRVLMDWDADIVAFVDPAAGPGDTCNGKPVLPPTAVREDERLSALPMVVASSRTMTSGIPFADQHAQQQFKCAVTDILFTHGLKNHLLHPAALHEWFEIDWSHRAIGFGKQGAGNTVYAHIFYALHKHAPSAFRASSYPALVFEKLEEGYTNIMLESMYNAAAAIGAGGCGFGPHVPFNCMMAMQYYENKTPHACNITGLPVQPWIYSPYYSYHELPDPAQISRLSRMGCKLFLVLRSPLDTLLSSMKKSADAMGVPLATYLAEPKAFSLQARQLFDELRDYIPCMEHMHVLRYERLLSEPHSVIRELGSLWKIDVKKHTAARIWVRIGFRQLPDAPLNHFWQGGKGKSRAWFTQEQLAVLAGMGAAEICAALGYESDAQLIASVPAQEPQKTRGAVPTQRHYMRSAGNIAIHSSHPGAADALEKHFSNPFVRTLANAGSPREERPESNKSLQCLVKQLQSAMWALTSGVQTFAILL